MVWKSITSCCGIAAPAASTNNNAVNETELQDRAARQSTVTRQPPLQLEGGMTSSGLSSPRHPVPPNNTAAIRLREMHQESQRLREEYAKQEQERMEGIAKEREELLSEDNQHPLGMSPQARSYLTRLTTPEQIADAWKKCPQIENGDDMCRFTLERLQTALDHAPPCTEKPILILIGEIHAQSPSPAAQKTAMEELSRRYGTLPEGSRALFSEGSEVNWDRAKVDADHYRTHGELPSDSEGRMGSESDRFMQVIPLIEAKTHGFDHHALERRDEIEADFGGPNALATKNFAEIVRIATSTENMNTRDVRMTNRIDAALSSGVKAGVAVVGLAHLAGVHDRLHEKYTVIPFALHQSLKTGRVGANAMNVRSYTDPNFEQPSILAKYSYALTHPDIIACDPTPEIMSKEKMDAMYNKGGSPRASDQIST